MVMSCSKTKLEENKRIKYTNNFSQIPFQKITIYLKSLRIWKTQKDFRLTAKTYLKTLNEKNFNNTDEIKNKQQKNKERYFQKLEKISLNHDKKIKKLSSELKKLINSSNKNNQELIDSLNQEILYECEQYNQNKNKLIFSYHAKNYLIQYKPYVFNQTIDKTIINIKSNKLFKCNKKVVKLDNLIKKLNQKLDKLIHPEPKIIRNSDGSLIKLERAPIDINKPTKKALNIINNINVYEAKKIKMLANKINIEHQFDLIKQQWKRNNFHELITNPYYKTNIK